MVYNNAMDKDKISKILNLQFNEKYYTPKELEYGNDPGIFISPHEYKELVEYKEDLALHASDFLTTLPLSSFNYRCIYYSLGNELKSLLKTYASLSNEDLALIDKFSSNFIESRIYSEIEGTLNVEKFLRQGRK